MTTLDWRMADLRPAAVRSALGGRHFPGAGTIFRLMVRASAGEAGATAETLRFLAGAFERVGGAAHLPLPEAVSFVAGASSVRPDVWGAWAEWLLLDREDGLAALEGAFETAGLASEKAFEFVARTAAAGPEGDARALLPALDAAVRAAGTHPRAPVLSACRIILEMRSRGVRRARAPRDCSALLARYREAFAVRDRPAGLSEAGRLRAASEALVNLLLYREARP